MGQFLSLPGTCLFSVPLSASESTSWIHAYSVQQTGKQIVKIPGIPASLRSAASSDPRSTAVGQFRSPEDRLPPAGSVLRCARKFLGIRFGFESECIQWLPLSVASRFTAAFGRDCSIRTRRIPSAAAGRKWRWLFKESGTEEFDWRRYAS